MYSDIRCEMKHICDSNTYISFSGINSEIRKRIITGRPDSTNDWRCSVWLPDSNTACSEEYQRKGPSRFFHRRRRPPASPRPRLYLLWSRVVLLEGAPLTSLRRPIFRILYEPRRPIIFLLSRHHSLSLALFSSGYYETRFQQRRRRTARREKEREGDTMENVGRVPARHCHFHRLAVFPQLFYLLFLAATSFHSCEKQC